MYNRLKPMVRGLSITSLALVMNTCGGSTETPHIEVPSYPWNSFMCEDLRQALQETTFSPEERQEQVQRCEDECSPPGREASRRYCANLYCCPGLDYLSLCGKPEDAWLTKKLPYFPYTECMNAFGVKPVNYCEGPPKSPVDDGTDSFSCLLF